MTHVQSQIVLATEYLRTDVTRVGLGNVSHLAVYTKSCGICKLFVAYRTLAAADLFQMYQVMLIKVVLRFKNEIFTFTLSVAASEDLIFHILKVLVCF